MTRIQKAFSLFVMPPLLFAGHFTSTAIAACPIPDPPDVLVLHLSEDAYKGDARFAVSVDGVAVAANQPITVHNSSGQTEQFIFVGNWGAGAHKIAVTLTNDAWDGKSSADGHDRNIFVQSIQYDNATLTPNSEIFSGSATFPTPVITGTKPDVLVLHLSEDAYNGDAQFIAYVDGKAVNASEPVTVHQPSGNSQRFPFLGNWGEGPHTVQVVLTNDAWDGTSSADGHDRNLFVEAVRFDRFYSVLNHEINSGSASFAIPADNTCSGTAGACGPSNGLPLTSAPSSGLCAAGTPSAVSGAGPWSWTCTGTDSAASSSCSALLPLSCTDIHNGVHASGSSYTVQLSQTLTTQAATVAQCPYGGTQQETTTVSQSYSCTNGTAAAQGSPVTTNVPTGSPICNTGSVNGACNSVLTSTPSGFSSKTLFPLGAYVGQPDNSNPTNQAITLSHFTSMTALMNSPPKFLDTYLNAGDPISHWAGQNGWQAASWHATPALANVIPVIGLPLTSTQDDFDTDYKAFAGGTYDTLLTTLVQTWSSQGFQNQYWRLGWEMNLNSNPSYGGDMGSQEQLDWIAAFKHVYQVLHAAGVTYGATINVIWNPGTTSYSNTGNAITYFYPGNSFVDVIGVDDYADLWTFSLYDFTTGQTDASLSAWESNPANLTHYYNYPAATQWSNDGSEGHSTTLLQLISLAQMSGKPLALVETGAGNSNNGGRDIEDNSIFPTWLAQTLLAAEQATPSVKVAFVNLWDSNGGGNYEFSYITDNKPNEAAAWSRAFGGQPIAPTSGLCTAGAASAVKGTGPFTWSCAGTNQGTTAACSTPPIEPNLAD